MAMKISLLLLLSLLLISSADSSFLDGLSKFLQEPKRQRVIIEFSKTVSDAFEKIKNATEERAAAAELVKNGGFEELNRLDSTSRYPGWKSKRVKLIDAKHFKVPFGKYAVELVAGRKSSLSQVILTDPNEVYILLFITGDAKNACYGNMKVEAVAAKQSESFRFKSFGSGDAKVAGFRFKAVGHRTRISFTSSSILKKINDLGTYCGPIIDGVIVFTL